MPREYPRSSNLGCQQKPPSALKTLGRKNEFSASSLWEERTPPAELGEFLWANAV